MHCIEKCIPKNFLMSRDQVSKAKEIISWIGYYKQTGRPPVDGEKVVQALYYLVRTGMQWKALPRCFGPASTIHAAFQRLSDLGFFDNFWITGLDEYNELVGLDLDRKVVDCTHIKSPVGTNAVGPSPVDRRKQGTKRSIITDGNGILLGCVVSAGNRNDAKLLRATLESLPIQLHSPGSHQIWLDAIYDTTEVRTLCFMHGLRPQISPNPRRKIVEPVRQIQRGVRWVIERTHSWMNRFRRLFIRYDKYAENYLAFIKFAAASHVFSRLRVSG
jgi:putative transposase